MAGFTYGHARVCGGIRLAGQPVSCGAVAAGAAGDHRHVGVVLGGQPAGEATLVASHAAGRRRDVGVCLARGRRAVVTGAAVGACGEGAVVHLGTRPGAAGFVAGFTHGDTAVHRGVGLAGQPVSGGAVAAGAAGGHRHVGVVLGRRPAGKATLVASHART